VINSEEDPSIPTIAIFVGQIDRLDHRVLDTDQPLPYPVL
jgi:hypothetical protein